MHVHVYASLLGAFLLCQCNDAVKLVSYCVKSGMLTAQCTLKRECTHQVL